MHRRFISALLLLVSLSLVPLATNPSGSYNHFTYLTAYIDKTPTPAEIDGTLYYSEFTLTGPANWQQTAITGTPTNLALVSSSSTTDALPGETILVYYLADKLGPDTWLLLPGTATTDAKGKFNFGLGDVDFNNLKTSCARVKAVYSDANTNVPTSGEVVYCKGSDQYFYDLMGGVAFSDCFPVFLVLGLLIGAMYASGSDPLRTFDITTPKLPSPKRKPMAGSAFYLTGWEAQRKGNLNAMSLARRGLERSYVNFEKSMGKLASGPKPSAKDAAGAARLWSVFRNQSSKELIDLLRGAKGLRDTQRILLIESIYFGQMDSDKNKDTIKRLTGYSREDLKRLLQRGSSRELRNLSRAMDARTHVQAKDVRKELRAEVNKLDEKMMKLNYSDRGDDFKAWTAFTMISGSSRGNNPGFRYTKEVAENSWKTSLSWMGLDNPLGRFIARTPILRGSLTTAVGSVNLITGIHGRLAKTVAVESAGRLLNAADKGGKIPLIGVPFPGLGDVLPGVNKANESFANRRWANQGRAQVGVIGNGFKEQGMELKSIAAELRARGKLSDAGAKALAQRLDVLYSEADGLRRDASRIKGDKTISDSEARKKLAVIGAQMGVIQQAYSREYNALGGEVAKILEEQKKKDALRRENKSGNLDEFYVKRLAQAINERMDLETRDNAKGPERARLEGDLVAAKSAMESAERSWSSSRSPASVNAYAAAVNKYSEIALKLHKKSIEGAVEGITKVERVIKENGTENKLLFQETKGRINALLAGGRAIESAVKNMEKVRAGGGALDSNIQYDLLRQQSLLIVKLKNPWRRMEELTKKVEGAAAGHAEFSERLIQEKGEVGKSAVSMINRVLDKEYGKVSPRDSIIPKGEMDLMRKKVLMATLRSDNPEIFDRYRAESDVMVSHFHRRLLSGRIEKLLKTGKAEDVQKMFDLVASSNWITENNPQNFMAKFFATGVRITKNDVMDQNALKPKIDAIMKGGDNQEVKAQKLAALMVEAFPWYRKRRTENLDSFNVHLTDEKKGMDLRAVDMFGAYRRFNAWKVSNEETLARGFLPGVRLNHDESAATGAWMAMPEGFWMPITAVKPKDNSPSAIADYQRRHKDVEYFLQPYTGSAVRLIYGKADNATGKVVELPPEERTSARAFRSIFEKTSMAVLSPIGDPSSDVKAGTVFTYRTLDAMKNYYENQFMTTSSDRIFKISDIRDRHLTMAQLKDKQNLQAFDDELRGLGEQLSQARARGDQAEAGRLSSRIRERGRELDREMSENERLLTAFTPRTAFRDHISAVVPWEHERMPKSTQLRGGHDITDHDVVPRDPQMDRIMLQLKQASYSMAFLGIIGVRSGRATDASQTQFGAISTYMAAGNPVIMERRRHNWVKTEWSEQDVPVAVSPGYGHLMRFIMDPATRVGQRIAGAVRPSVLEMDGYPAQWEPQYLNYDSRVAGGLEPLVSAMFTYIPVPGVSQLSRARYTLNPARDGYLARSEVGQALGVSNFKYAAYAAASNIGVPSMTLRGHDLDSWRVGGPRARMAYVDKTYNPAYSGGYPPLYYTDPFGTSRMFPSFESRIQGTFEGLAVDRPPPSYQEVFRKETTAFENLSERDQYLKQYGGWKKVILGQATPVALMEMGSHMAQRHYRTLMTEDRNMERGRLERFRKAAAQEDESREKEDRARYEEMKGRAEAERTRLEAMRRRAEDEIKRSGRTPTEFEVSRALDTIERNDREKLKREMAKAAEDAAKRFGG